MFTTQPVLADGVILICKDKKPILFYQVFEGQIAAISTDPDIIMQEESQWVAESLHDTEQKGVFTWEMWAAGFSIHFMEA